MNTQGDPPVSPAREEQGEGSGSGPIDYKNPLSLLKEDGTFNSQVYNVPNLFRFTEIFPANKGAFWDTRSVMIYPMEHFLFFFFALHVTCFLF
jgi:hypothetical protein